MINDQSYSSKKSLTFTQWPLVMLSAITCKSFYCFATRATIITRIRMTNITQGRACKEKRRQKLKNLSLSRKLHCGRRQSSMVTKKSRVTNINNKIELKINNIVAIRCIGYIIFRRIELPLTVPWTLRKRSYWQISMA